MNKIFILMENFFSEKVLKILCAVLLTAALLILPIRRSYAEKTAACSADYPLLNFTVVLDAGHGGEDGGAIGIKTLVREKTVNLSITKKLAGMLESVGADVVLTRSDDDALCKGKYSKAEDMRLRAAIIDKVQPYLVVSIHCNSFPDRTDVTGAQVFYLPGSVTGERLAEAIRGSVCEILPETRSRQSKSADFYMLRHGNSTNVLVECGFLSSPKEEEKLCDNDYQNRLAYAIFDGICTYIASIRTPSV